MKTNGINIPLAFYSAVMTFLTFISLFYTIPALSKISLIEPALEVVKYSSSLNTTKMTELTKKIDLIQLSIASISRDIQWLKNGRRCNEKTLKEIE